MVVMQFVKDEKVDSRRVEIPSAINYVTFYVIQMARISTVIRNYF